MKWKWMPAAASLLLTEDCNLRCTYCFEKHNKKKMSNEVALKSLEFLSNNAIENKQNYFSVTMFGGEPLLQPDLMEFIFKNGHRIAQEKKIHFSVTIITNATIMSDKIFNMLSYWNTKISLSVQLSVDGKKESHDLYRITAAGIGSFYLIEKNIPKFKEIFKNNPKSLNIHGVINKKTLPKLYENYKMFREEWGFSRIWFLILQSETEWSYEDVAIYEENLRLIADYQLNIVRREGNIDEIRNYAPIDKCLSFERNLSNSPCGAGKNFVTITANGEIYPCHHFYFNDPNKETKIGDLDNGLDEAARRIYIDYDGTDLTCEKNCPNNSCYRCIAQNWTDKGSIFSQIKGINCLFSGVEKKIQDYTLKELRKMGIFNKSNQKSNNPNCLCDLRSGENQSNQSNNSDCYCDLRTGNSQTEGVGCGNNVTPKNNQSKESDCYCDLRTGNTQTIFPEGEKQMSCELNDEKKSKKEIDIILINQLAEAVIKIIDEIEEIKKKIE